MRKKKLLELSEDLFNRLDAAQIALKEIKQENEELKKLLEELTEENKTLKENYEQSQPLKALSDKIKGNANLSKDTEYGAQIIGKIVISAAEHCNRLTLSSESREVKELINLILGRTEVAKAEILKAISSDIDFEQKKTLIDAQKNAAEDYFGSVMAQL